jgi:hypothetical protein
MPLLGVFYITRRRSIKTLLAIGVLIIAAHAKVLAQSPTEEELKSLYIYNFINFVEWPSTAFQSETAPFVIGVAGEGNYLHILKELVKGETYKGRRIEVRRIDGHAKARECHIIFIERRATIIDQLISGARGESILTISDADNFLQSGGMTRFFLEESKVKIEMNHTLAQERQLLVSAKLLRLAKLYKQ